MHDHATSCIAHERLRVEYGLVRKSCMNHARTCKIFFLGISFKHNQPQEKKSYEVEVFAMFGCNMSYTQGTDILYCVRVFLRVV